MEIQHHVRSKTKPMEVQYRDTLPNDVRSAFDKAIEALPQEHLRPTKLSGAAMEG
ncbi:hypothetical protein FOVG_19163 [Fusarium oxysporum f. sp. pisi HDV247]|uniref:Uncharacterized protein n=1 Tax=Fusarium oxysporum f. sp. pisi HDV247 TaxID=1080344 RepID=W9N9Q5_FUSOX|nr:hypothetical protein FOVG_19163 [Fusarium oxysporum f. sp. pisi HDV247]